MCSGGTAEDLLLSWYAALSPSLVTELGLPTSPGWTDEVLNLN
jgi:hypothetical protein